MKPGPRVVRKAILHETTSARNRLRNVFMNPSRTVQQSNTSSRRLSPDSARSVAPALEKYTEERLYGEVWKRPGLSLRDRSLITIAALIARGQTPALMYYADQAIENGVKPRITWLPRI